MRLRYVRLKRQAEKPVAADPAAVGNEKQELHDLVEEVPIVRRTDICDPAFRAHFSVSKHLELYSIEQRKTFDRLLAIPMRFLIIPLALIVSTSALFGQPNRTGSKPEAVKAGGQLFRAACSGCHGATGGGGRGPNIRDGRLVRRMSSEQLFDSIKTGVPGTDMPAFPMADEKTWAVVAFVRSLSAPAIEANVPGDEPAGDKIFFGKGGCSGCHAVRGRGGFLGPDLSNAGTQRSIGQLRESVLDPSARLTEGFQGVDVVLKSGGRISGVAKNYTNYAMQVLDRNGEMHLLDKKDVQEITLHRKSLMPGDYSTRLTAAELQDLLAYLSRQAMRNERRVQ